MSFNSYSKRVIDTIDSRELLRKKPKTIADSIEYYILSGSYDYSLHRKESTEKVMF